MSKKKTSATTTTTLLALGLVAAGASASQLSFPGTVCVPQANNSTTTLFSKNGISNTSATTSLAVECSAPRASSVRNVSAVTVRVIDRSPTANDLCCTARVLDSGGSILQTSAQRCAAAGTAAQTLSLDVNAAGMLNVACSIPKTDPTNGGSWVASYTYAN
jgi:hypothetical protein